MTKNFHRDGNPTGIYAVASQRKDGTFGVLVGCGGLVIAFVTEDQLPRYFEVAESGTDQDATDKATLHMMRDAAADLEGLKLSVKAARAVLN